MQFSATNYSILVFFWNVNKFLAKFRSLRCHSFIWRHRYKWINQQWIGDLRSWRTKPGDTFGSYDFWFRAICRSLLFLTCTQLSTEIISDWLSNFRSASKGKPSVQYHNTQEYFGFETAWLFVQVRVLGWPL